MSYSINHNHSYEPVTTSIENGHIQSITKEKEKHKDQQDEEAYEEELLSTWDLIKLCIPVIPSQLGWAVGEALLIPYLISLGVEETLANAIWLVNPLVGFFLQPLIGSFSDHCHSRWGRRRPFLLLFHLGIMIGLLTICFCNEILAFITTRPALTSDNHATTELLIIIFTGCVIMELSNDLLTIPSRALLNDQLPEKQLEQGNAMFAMMNSAGAVVGLTMCLVPLQKTWPFSLLETQLRATFMMSVILIMTSNFFTMSIPEWMDDENETDDTVEEDQPLLTNELSTRSAPLYGEGNDEDEGEEGEGEGEGEDDDEQVADPEHMGIYKSLTAFRLLPKELIAIWVVQFAWWLTVMQISFWWTTWIGIEVFHADAILSHDLFYDGVQYGIIQLLIHSIVSFFASHALTWTNNTFGVTRVYHASAVLFAASCCALWWWRTRTASMLFMVFTGILYPVINTNPFILIEVYTTYDEEEGEGEGEEGEGEETTTTETVPTGQAVVIPATISSQDTSTTSSTDPVVPSTILIIPEPSPPEHDTPIDIDTDDMMHTPHTHTRRYRSALAVLTESEASDRDSGTSSEEETTAEPESPMPPLIPVPVTPTTTVPATPTPIGIPLEATPNVTPSSPPHRMIEASPSGYSPDRHPMRSQSDMDGASSDSDTSLDLSDTSPLVLGRPASDTSLSRLTLQSTSLPDNTHPSHDVLQKLQSHASPDITIQYHDADTVDAGISHHMYRHRSDSEIYHPAVPFRGRTRSMDGMSESDSEGFSTTTGTGTGSGSDDSSPSASPRSDTGDDQSPRVSRSLLPSTSSTTSTTTSTTIPTTTTTSTSTSLLPTLTDHHLYNSEHEDEKNHVELISPHNHRVTFPHSSGMSTTTVVDESQGMEEEDESEEYLDANLHRGVLTAIMNLSMGLSQVISATLGGIIIKYVGDITIVFLLSGVLSIVVNVVVVMMGWSSRDETAEEEEEEAAEAEAEAETEAVSQRKITPVIVPIASLTAEQQLAVAATSTEASISVQNAINEEAAAAEAKEEKEKWDAMEAARQAEREERRRMIQARRIAKEKARREKWKKEREALLQHLRDQPSQPQPVPQSTEKKEADTLLSTSLPEYGSFDLPYRKHRRKHRKHDEHVIDIGGYERDREKEKKHRKRHRPRHHHLNMAADISSRRGLSGRYAVGDEADIERERLHLHGHKQRKTPALGPIPHPSISTSTSTSQTTTSNNVSKDIVASQRRKQLRQKRSKDLRRKLQRSASTAQQLLSKTP